MTAAIILCAVLWLAALAVIWATDSHERRALEHLALLEPLDEADETYLFAADEFIEGDFYLWTCELREGSA